MTKLKKTIKEIEENFIEIGADIEHDRWARWQKYLHSLCKKNEDRTLTISKERVIHWEREIATPYSNLTEELKEYDRKETRNYLPLLKTSQTKLIESIIEEIKKKIEPPYKGKHKGKSFCPQCEDCGYQNALEDIMNLTNNK